MQKNKRADIEKWDQTGSPEIPDSGETLKKNGLPSGFQTRATHKSLLSVNGGLGKKRSGDWVKSRKR